MFVFEAFIGKVVLFVYWPIILLQIIIFSLMLLFCNKYNPVFLL